MKENKIKSFLKLVMFLFCIVYVFFFLFYANVSAAETCEQRYSDGVCKDESDCQDHKDVSAGLCPNNKICCFKSAADPQLDLQVPIFGYTKAKNLAEYITKIYEYALFVLVPLAIVVIIWAGFLWLLAGGDVPKISNAKKYISGAVTGLIIAFLSYIILSFFGLTTLTSLQIEYIEEIPSEDLNIPLNPAIDKNFATELSLTPTPGSIYCPKSGGAAVMEQITKSTYGKVTYRFGGKGGRPPYSEIKSQYMQYNTYCPSGTVCLDCSGYANFVIKCAGLKSYGGGTFHIFGCGQCRNSEVIRSFTATSVNGIPLKPGDLVGYPTGCEKDVIGHVWVYVGNGVLYESRGGHTGRQPGNAIRATPFGKYNWLNKTKCIRRI